MAEIINKYETIFVLDAALEEEKITALSEKFQKLIADNGTVESVDVWGKRKLAYEIQKMKEGFYYFIQFDADAACPGELEQRLRIQEPVIRYLCVKQEA